MIVEYDHGARGPRDTRSHTQYTPTNPPHTTSRIPFALASLDAALTSLDAALLTSSEAVVVERWTAPDQAGAVTGGAVEIEGRKRRAQRGVVLWGELRGVCTDAAVGGLCSRIYLFILGGRTGGWWRWWRERWWLVVAVMVVVVVCEGGTSVTNE